MTRRLSLVRRLHVLLLVWSRFVRVLVVVRRNPLPTAVTVLGTTEPGRRRAYDAHTMGSMIWRRLRIGPWRPRCLFRALVLYRLMREQGEHVQLVIGLPDAAESHEAHAWVIRDGVDLGPWPGGANHAELVRYG
jgi:hypothetical protein